MESHDEEEYDGQLEHIGIKRRSGRYPWGSGEDPHQRSKDFKTWYNDLKEKNPGITDAEIANSLGLVNKYGKSEFTSTHLRAANASATEIIREQNIDRAKYLRYTQQMSNRQIAVALGLTSEKGESTVRGWLKETDELKANSLKAIGNKLKEESESKPFMDVGLGTHLHMGVNSTKLNTALIQLQDEGYNVYPIKLPQAAGENTTYRILCKEGVTFKEAAQAVREGRIQSAGIHSDDGGLNFKRDSKGPPTSVDLKRIDVRFKEDGGQTMDGVIELRRGVADLDLGANKYAQVRIAVNGTHYLKGMAMYADDLPAGSDIRFNTNKSKNDSKVLKNGKLGAMKDMEDDAENPFGSQTLPALMYKDSKGKEKKSALNMVNEEGDWDDWSKSLSSQMLSKQSLTLAAAQLKQARTERETEFKKIMSLTNPMVREKLLKEFSEEADSAAVSLKAAALPRQANKVILPFNSIRPHEIYAPDFNNGEKVVLVRHPHGGPFEIPELTVNNYNRSAARVIKGAKDAVGIHHSVAEQLSGADFDGDTVLVIPNDSRKVKTTKPWPELTHFDPKIDYKIPDSDTKTTRMTKENTQTEMGKISNLITDMSLQDAPKADLVRAVRHSMVVIDAEKHGLDYKRSAEANGIAHLKEKYQKGARSGASTIISRASSSKYIDEVKPRKIATGGPPIDPVTGKKVFVPTGAMRQVRKVNKETGEVTYLDEWEPKKTKTTKMADTDDARTLLSDKAQPMERLYADYANAMKALGNEARREMVAIKSPKISAAAKAVYAPEVQALKAKLERAQRNAPLERRAQSVSVALTKARIEANPGLDKDAIKKIRYKSLEDARLITDAKKIRIGSKESPLSAREWEAIQAGALPATTVRAILANADMDRVRELATPKPRTSLTTGQLARAKQMEAAGRSLSEIASALGIPRSTISDNLS